jgi:dienelactone hydrolase
MHIGKRRRALCPTRNSLIDLPGFEGIITLMAEKSICRWYVVLFLVLWSQQSVGTAQKMSHSVDPASPSERLNYHTAPTWTNRLMKEQHRYTITSPLICDDGTPVGTPENWYQKRRPELLRHWTRILGKLTPAQEDKKWFGDIRKTVIHATEEKEGYTRIVLSLPIEKDFLQPHVLLLPRNQGSGPFPAVIAWTSTSPDYTQPEVWWGRWLARRGYVVLTGWSFIRHYREGKTYHDHVNEMVYERFGHWLPMAKMVHDVQREVEYLRTRPEVDAKRLGFIGFSLSAKAALYVAAFAPDIKATVAVDPHLALHGDSNYHDPWYLDWQHKFDTIETEDYPIAELRGTVWSLLDADPARPGFERNHHELIALCAPRGFLLIGCSMDKMRSPHSDNLQSWGYFNRAQEVYDLLGVGERLEFRTATDGHQATSAHTDPAWQQFFERQLKGMPSDLISCQ